ncbi:hypothetical protein QFC19_006809 [Naganishia cerealis]|uniref:Uncharacterized protein n=1 Tax=Naganishia cerealis TaxID=610337 RepID=A0ACC2VEN3_9TREE|nr:hypothetical protein QFC19_006809 [Naganishia cerealis]
MQVFETFGAFLYRQDLLYPRTGMSTSTAATTAKAYITPVWTRTFKRCRARQSPSPATTSTLRLFQSAATLSTAANPAEQSRSISGVAVQSVAPETESSEPFVEGSAGSSEDQQRQWGYKRNLDVETSDAPAASVISKPAFPLYRPEPFVSPSYETPEIAIPSSRAELKKAVEQLEQETKTLEAHAAHAEKLKVTNEATADLPPYTEADLEEFYRSVMTSAAASVHSRAGLLAAPQTSSTVLLGPGEENDSEPRRKIISQRERREILEGLERRLTFSHGEELASSRGKAKDYATALVDDSTGSVVPETPHGVPATTESRPIGPRRREDRKRVLGLIQSLTPAPAEKPPARATAENNEIPNDKALPTTTPTIQTGLISRSEFLALFDECIQSRDLSTAVQVLDSMRDHGLTVPIVETTSLLEAYAKKGDSAGIAELLEKEERLGRPPTRAQLATMVQAHLCAGQKHQAVRLLHDLEARQLTLPQSAYRSVIDTLLAPSPTMKQADKALAWDLFTHMRLVAHPVPSIELYNTMIRACADSKDPQPELALDMFTQMVQENQQTPTADTYNMMIRALAKVKKYYFESFRLLRQMLEIHQAALQAGLAPGQVETGYEPTVVTFNALLEGTKRVGDLGRARWILAEMAKIGTFVGEGQDTRMLANEETLVNVFHTYAAFRPLIGRADLKVTGSQVHEQEMMPLPDGNASAEQPESTQATSLPLHDEAVDNEEPPQHLPRPMSLLDIGSPDFVPPYQPQTSYEAFTEASQLFDLAVFNIISQEGVFRQAHLTPRLINAYLSVALAHAPLDKALHMQLDIWHDQRILGLEQNLRPNGWTYLFALERCAAAKNKTEKRFLTENDVVEQLWQGYEQWYSKEVIVANRIKESAAKRSQTILAQEEVDKYRLNVGLGPREVERCWVAVIAALALIENTSRALQLLGEFRDRFPPDAIISAYSPSPQFANKIRFSPSQRILEDDVPPHILFHDVERLHHRFIRDGNLQGVGKIKWTTLGYQLALEKRKNLRLREKKVRTPSKTSTRHKAPPFSLTADITKQPLM